ncbi:MAG: DUF1616 domain-containing protein [Nanoarchaeota archaeon]|nr:DUF1616 domain-containing protein [Nanoarchaeota archaeon]MBU0977817.1 DUF1616 domain-containing protein [Nanoarchaeota archaeon]
MDRRADWMKLIIRAVIVLIALELVTVVVGFFSEMSYFESFRVVFGSVYVLFLPGFVWSFVFFPARAGLGEGGRRIDIIERIALSFALSIAIVPLAVFYLNLVGLKISVLSSFFVVLVLILIGAGAVWWKGGG